LAQAFLAEAPHRTVHLPTTHLNRLQPAMGPVKFDDIPKVATEILNDDFQVSGYVLKAKQKTSWDGALLSSQVDLFPDTKCATPAKLTWKFPKPLGVGHFAIDKLEMDKGGKFKFECSSNKLRDGLRVEGKSDLADVSKIVVGAQYTGVKDTQLKIEHKAASPKEFTGEVTHMVTHGKHAATCGVKFTNDILSAGLPDFGMRFVSGPLFCSVIAREKFGCFNAYMMYKASPDVRCAATYQHGGKANGNFAVGVAYKGLAKLKVSQDQSIFLSIKHHVAKGFSLLGGAKYNVKKGDYTYGLQLSIE